MSYIDHTDNIYPVGTFITAKSAPEIKLKIVKYFNRIYYCEITSDTTASPLAFFERELIAPR